MEKTQTQLVLERLKSGRGITSLEAFREFGITRLSAIIFNLRKRGLDIESQTIEVDTRYGGRTRVARYVLRGGVENM